MEYCPRQHHWNIVVGTGKSILLQPSDYLANASIPFHSDKLRGIGRILAQSRHLDDLAQFDIVIRSQANGFMPSHLPVGIGPQQVERTNADVTAALWIFGLPWPRKERKEDDEGGSEHTQEGSRHAH